MRNLLFDLINFCLDRRVYEARIKSHMLKANEYVLRNQHPKDLNDVRNNFRNQRYHRRCAIKMQQNLRKKEIELHKRYLDND